MCSVLSWAVVDFLIIRGFWRAVDKARGTPARKEVTPLLKTTLLLHAALLAAAGAVVFVTAILIQNILGDMRPPGNGAALGATATKIAVGVFVICSLILGIDSAICLLARKLGGARGLRWWSRGFITALVIFLVLPEAALYLRIHKYVTVFHPAASQTQPQPSLHTGPPYEARLSQGTVELVGLAPNPSAGAASWLPDGSPAWEPFPSLGGTDSAAGRIVREIAFRIRHSRTDASTPVLRFDNPSESRMGSALRWDKTVMTYTQAIACPPEATELNVKVGVAQGDWQTALSVKRPQGSSGGGGDEISGPDGHWAAYVEVTAGRSGDVGLALSYSARDDYETRLVYIKSNGVVASLQGVTSQRENDMIHTVVLLGAIEYSQIKEFQLQKRSYEWVEFRNVSARPSSVRAIVHSIDAPRPETTQSASSSAAPAADRAPTALPPSAAVLAEQPQLRFLAWQDKWKIAQADKLGAAFHRDGSPVSDPAELRLLNIIPPNGCDYGRSGTNPSFLYLWFSHPLFDRQSLNEVTLLDAKGVPIPPGADGMLASAERESDQIDGETGWLTHTLCPGSIPPTVTVRLRYSLGPWEGERQFKIDEQGTIALGNGSQFNGIGQNAAGKAFFALAVDMKQDGGRQFGVVAVTKEGRDLQPVGFSGGGGVGEAVYVQRFEFAAPLAEIAYFRLSSRPIRTIEYKDLALSPHLGLPCEAHFAHGTVQLLALTSYPTPGASTWSPDGMELVGLSPWKGAETSTGMPVEGKHVLTEIACRVTSSAGSPSEPVITFDKNSGMSCPYHLRRWEDESKSTLMFRAEIEAPPDAKEANFKIGVANGEWETVLGVNPPAGSTPLPMTSNKKSEPDGTWEARLEAVTGEGGNLAVTSLLFHYSIKEEFETRVVSVGEDGTVIPLEGVNGAIDQYGERNSAVRMAAVKYQQIKEFQLQRRPYQWVEFRNVSLQLFHGTSVEAVDASPTLGSATFPPEAVGAVQTGPLEMAAK